eukprot:Gb_37522 [translate_table: standard]
MFLCLLHISFVVRTGYRLWVLEFFLKSTTSCSLMALVPGCVVEKLFKRTVAWPSLSVKQPSLCIRSLPVACLPPTKRSNKLFVTGLSFYTSEKSLENAFSDFGKIVSVRIIIDKISKRSKGYGFVEYSSEEEANEALQEMNGKILNGRQIIVDVAKTEPQYGGPRPREVGTSDSNREPTAEAVDDLRNL